MLRGRGSHYRAYATEAFRLLAREGSAEAYRGKILEAVCQRQREEGGGGLPMTGSQVEATLLKAERERAAKAGTIRDLEAAEAALAVVERMPEGRHRVEAVKAVYMVNPWQPLRRGDIRDRVCRASITIPASERAIYKWLADARDLFAEARELRTGD